MNTPSRPAQPFPDLLTPKGFPDSLAHPDYDPLGLMPPDPLPPHPRLFVTPALLETARRHVQRVAWAQRSLERLQNALGHAPDSPPPLPAPQPNPDLNTRWMEWAFRAALAHHLTGRRLYRQKSLALFRRIAEAYPRWPARKDVRATRYGLAESRFLLTAAWTFDLLAADGLRHTDEVAFRTTLGAMIQTASANPHHTCGNHNAWHLAARLAAAAAIIDRRQIHHAIYGAPDPVGWRYGLLHQWRHDFLPDGPHWEGSLGYHFYTLMAMTEVFVLLDHLGAPVWHKSFLAQQQNDGQDHPRAYGPPNGMRTIKDFYNIPFFWMHPNGDLPLFHDSGLAHLRGAYVWGILYNKAWEVWADPKYAWLLNRMEKEIPPARREFPDLPMPLQSAMGDADFARLHNADIPPGSFRLPRRAMTLSLTGRYTPFSSLFPQTGAAILRSSPSPTRALSVALFWGPHWAGHMNPAALNIELWAHGHRLSAPPGNTTYDDSLHLAWNRTTVAHNTLVVDERPMFPYDIEHPSPWEEDTWRDRRSDGQLEGFQTDRLFSAIRVSNLSVYPGVRLDRTLLLTEHFILDLYRAAAQEPHLLDWVHHLYGTVTWPEAVPGTLSNAPGYRLLRNVRRWPRRMSDRLFPLSWSTPSGIAHLILWISRPATLLAADDPTPARVKPFMGALETPPPSTALLLRTRGRSALFIALWTFENPPSRLRVRQGTALSDVVLEIVGCQQRHRWRFPARLNASPTLIAIAF